MMREMKMTEFFDVLASAEPVPGGGGASAAVGAFAAALGRMVANLTIGKKKYADVEAEVQEINTKLETYQNKLAEFIDLDAEAFLPLSQAYKMPRETEEEKARRAEVIEEALYVASITPIHMMETILEVMKLLEILGEKGSVLAVSDAATGVLFGRGALEGASMNVFINTGMMKNREIAEELQQKANGMIAEAKVIRDRVYCSVLEKIR